MVRIDIAFLLLASACLIIGVCLGIYMGVNKDLQLSRFIRTLISSAWTSLAVFGAIYRLYPELAASRLARAQFWLSAPSAVVFPCRNLFVAGSSDPCSGDCDVSALVVGRAGVLRDGRGVGVSAIVVSPGHASGSMISRADHYEMPVLGSGEGGEFLTWHRPRRDIGLHSHATS
jgi:hypothetical protein